MGRKKREIDYIAVLKKMAKAGIRPPTYNETEEEEKGNNNNGDSRQGEDKGETGEEGRKTEREDIRPLEERIQSALAIVSNTKNQAGQMLFFVMYDIESDKVRRYVVKYLEKQGCCRIQKSIFLANLPVERFNEIKGDLEEVQAVYENNDSILVVPITSDYLKAMKIIGQNVNVDVITHSKSTLFF